MLHCLHQVPLRVQSGSPPYLLSLIHTAWPASPGGETAEKLGEIRLSERTTLRYDAAGLFCVRPCYQPQPQHRVRAALRVHRSDIKIGYWPRYWKNGWVGDRKN